MKKAKRILSGMLVAVMAAALLAGCGSADSGAAASGQHYNLAYQCAWGSGGGPYQYASDLSKAIVEATGGRVTMECLATNSIVPTTEMLQAVSNGTLDCAQTAATNFSDDSLGILSTLPVGMTFDEYMGWYIAGEGQQVLDEVMAQIDSNVVAFPCGVVDSEILYHSTKPIKCLDDIKGLKIRGVSDWANIETRLGASVVTMDGGDCYEALSHGTIDAAEYSSPSANWAAGFQEVAPYLTVPGVHQSCSVYLFLINRNIWDGLDAQTQNIIKLACTAMMAQNWAEDRAANGKAWEQFRELERVVLLKVIDGKWMDHIDDMDQLRQGIGLQAYGQRDPLVEYKMAGFDMFDEMISAIQEDTIRLLFHVQVEQKVEREQVAKVTGTNKDETVANAPKKREHAKVYPNDPCPCGSGKKYKQCCGRKTV